MAGAKRNGEIELLRFVFAMVVMFYHINNQLEIQPVNHVTFFSHGKIAVEFFFAVSGYLMAASAKRKYNTPDIVHETGQFMRKKFWSIFPYHIICFAVAFVLVLRFSHFPSTRHMINTALSSLPNLFLVQNSGMYQRNILTPEWYITAMLWMMLLLYPLLLRFKEKFSQLAAPLICVVLVGYLIHVQGKLGGTTRFVFNETVPKIYVRAFAEMCGGIFGYEIVQALKRLKLKLPVRLLLTGVEALCFIVPIAYACCDWSEKYEGYAFYFLLGGVILCFSEVSVFCKLFNNPVVYYLGRLSLPIYYTHRLPLILYRIDEVSAIRPRNLVLLTVAVTLVLSVLLTPVSKLLMKPIHRKIERLHNREVTV